MKSIKLLASSTLVFALLGFASCGGPMLRNITKQYPPLADSVEVVIYDWNDTVPEHSEVLGGVVINRPGWDNVLKVAEKEARAVGGNGIEIQLHESFLSDSLQFQRISAFILNVNDSIVPTTPVAFEKMKFNDYIVTKEGDTIRGLIVEESKKQLKIVHGFNRQGYRKAIETRKSNLLSYHVEDPKALAEANFNKNKQQKVLFTAQVAIDGGYSVGGSYALAANARFSRKNKNNASGFNSHTFGLHYDYSCTPDITQFIAGSIGFMAFTSRVQPKQDLDYYLDSACNFPKVRKKSVFFTSLLLGYVNYESGGFYYHRSSAIGLGFDWGHDFMLNEHFALGWMYCGYIGIPLDNEAGWCGAFNITAGLRYYW